MLCRVSGTIYSVGFEKNPDNKEVAHLTYSPEG